MVIDMCDDKQNVEINNDKEAIVSTVNSIATFFKIIIALSVKHNPYISSEMKIILKCGIGFYVLFRILLLVEKFDNADKSTEEKKIEAVNDYHKGMSRGLFSDLAAYLS